MTVDKLIAAAGKEKSRFPVGSGLDFR